MKLITYLEEGYDAIGAVAGDAVVELTSLASSMIALLEDPEGLRRAASKVNESTRNRRRCRTLAEISLLPPVVRPSKVIGVAMNHRSFNAGLEESDPQYPVLFHKTSSALIGSGADIVIPQVTSEVVPEGELAVVIGRRARSVTSSLALDFVAGFACANDVSARDLEFRTSQWTSGKMLDTFCPLGPALVTSEELPTLASVRLRTRLNGSVIQTGGVEGMIFDIPHLVAEISCLVTLEPGDVILTGTPSDLGALQSPIFLRPGDSIAVEITGLGSLRNQVRASA